MLTAQSTERLYYKDSHLYTCSATVVQVTDTLVVLDKTPFHPAGGGQPSDTGTISSSQATFFVDKVNEADDGLLILHHGKWSCPSDTPLPLPGSLVTASISKPLRDRAIVLHSAGHLLDLALLALRPDFVATKAAHFEGNCSVEYIGAVAPDQRPAFLAQLQAAVDSLLERDGKVSCAIDSSSGFRTVQYEGGVAAGCGGTHVSRFREIERIVIDKISKKGKLVKVKYSVPHASSSSPGLAAQSPAPYPNACFIGFQ